MPSLSCFIRLARTTTLAAVLGYGGTASAANLSVCIDKASPTSAMDAALARAVARHEGATVKIDYFDGSGDDDGFDLDEFADLAERCDLVLGFPVDPETHALPAGLSSTAPYGHTGFVLVTPSGSPAASLDQLPKGTAVAVGYQTTPNLYFIDHPNLHADVHLTDEEALAALVARKVSAAMVWRPTVASYQTVHAETARFDMHDLDAAHARFNLVALYGEPHAAAAKAFDDSVIALASAGELDRVITPYLKSGAVAESSNKANAGKPAEAVAQATPPKPAAPQPATPATPAPQPTAPAPAAAGATPPALYTSAQADQGKEKYAENCAICHGPTLAGRAGPALKGPTFASPTAGFSVSDIFVILSQNMPATNPGSLEQDDYVQIMAYLLQQNGYPAGTTALTFDEAGKSKVPLIYRGQ